MAWTYEAPISGDTNYVATLTNCVNEIQTEVDTKLDTTESRAVSITNTTASTSTTTGAFKVAGGVGIEGETHTKSINCLSSSLTLNIGETNTAITLPAENAIYLVFVGQTNASNGQYTAISIVRMCTSTGSIYNITSTGLTLSLSGQNLQILNNIAGAITISISAIRIELP